MKLINYHNYELVTLASTSHKNILGLYAGVVSADERSLFWYGYVCGGDLLHKRDWLGSVLGYDDQGHSSETFARPVLCRCSALSHFLLLAKLVEHDLFMLEM